MCKIFVAKSGYNIVFDSLENPIKLGYNSVSYNWLIKFSNEPLISVSTLSKNKCDFLKWKY